ncbi:MAG: enoyl-CoA hydratase/isomerase family protein [Sphingopyxis sp.]|uniref:enoyl-CoA hydratase/isomerase family protein n=1 Tax=Sphingopyxis sp. TaxID=1908224 RepID=UPI003D6CF71B
MTPQEPDDVLLVTRDGPVATVMLNRPHRRNAVTQDMLDALAAFFAACRRDRECKAIILHGAGDHFCVGLDLVGAHGDDPILDELLLGDWGLADILRDMRACPQPIVMLGNGSIAGAGLIFALAADIIIASDDAFFTTAFINLGLSGTELGVAWRLQRTVGLSLAREMAFTSARLPADRALTAGLVSHVVPKDALLAEGRAMANRIAQYSQDALRLTKRNLDLALQSPSVEISYELEERAQLRRAAGGALDEALAAFNARKSGN